MVNRQFLNLSTEEKNFLEKISSISCVDKSTIKDILQAILKTITIEHFVDSNEVYIPYICSFEIDCYEKITENGVKTIINLNAEPSKHLIKEIKSINEGELLPTQNYTRQKIFDEIEKIVE